MSKKRKKWKLIFDRSSALLNNDLRKILFHLKFQRYLAPPAGLTSSPLVASGNWFMKEFSHICYDYTRAVLYITLTLDEE